MYVPIGGIEQWIEISEGDPSLPVLLFLHGGPGATTLPAKAAWKPWEEQFRVVHWDQRGAGRTFAKNGEGGCGPLTIDRMVRDGLDVIDYLNAHLHNPKILLVGHSWGSILAVHMLKRRPQLCSIYVGTGQAANMRLRLDYMYRHQLALAERLGNTEALQVLRDLGPPPYTELGKIKAVAEMAIKLAEGDNDRGGDSVLPRPSPKSMDFTAEDKANMMKGVAYSQSQLFAEVDAVDLPSLLHKFEIPVFFFLGAADPTSPLELAEQYFNAIEAPHKELVPFEGCHHFVAVNRPQDFLRELLARVRPLM